MGFQGKSLFKTHANVDNQMRLKRPFLKATALTLVFLSLDLALVALVYYTLPDTKALLKGVTLSRKGNEDKIFTFVAGPANKKYVSLSRISRQLPRAVLILEDSRFYQHRGFDFIELAEAVTESFQDGDRLRGASTLTQQLVKNLYLSPERSFRRKILEALITIKMELTLTKPQILELYLNSIDWGRGLFGVREAARHYFRKSPIELSLREAVFLAAIIPNPRRFGRLVEGTIPRLFVRRQMMRALRELYRRGQIRLDDYQQVIREIQGD